MATYKQLFFIKLTTYTYSHAYNCLFLKNHTIFIDFSIWNVYLYAISFHAHWITLDVSSIPSLDTSFIYLIEAQIYTHLSMRLVFKKIKRFYFKLKNLKLNLKKNILQVAMLNFKFQDCRLIFTFFFFFDCTYTFFGRRKWSSKISSGSRFFINVV